MRLNTRSSVDLPQPEGPMKAVMLPVDQREVDVLQRLGLAVVEVQVPHLELHRVRRVLRRARAAPSRTSRQRPSALARADSARDTTMRAVMLRMRMLSVMSSAPDQASCCQFG